MINIPKSLDHIALSVINSSLETVTLMNALVKRVEELEEHTRWLGGEFQDVCFKLDDLESAVMRDSRSAAQFVRAVFPWVDSRAIYRDLTRLGYLREDEASYRVKRQHCSLFVNARTPAPEFGHLIVATPTGEDLLADLAHSGHLTLKKGRKLPPKAA